MPRKEAITAAVEENPHEYLDLLQRFLAEKEAPQPRATSAASSSQKPPGKRCNERQKQAQEQHEALEQPPPHHHTLLTIGKHPLRVILDIIRYSDNFDGLFDPFGQCIVPGADSRGIATLARLSMTCRELYTHVRSLSPFDPFENIHFDTPYRVEPRQENISLANSLRDRSTRSGPRRIIVDATGCSLQDSYYWSSIGGIYWARVKASELCRAYQVMSKAKRPSHFSQLCIATSPWQQHASGEVIDDTIRSKHSDPAHDSDAANGPSMRQHHGNSDENRKQQNKQGEVEERGEEEEIASDINKLLPLALKQLHGLFIFLQNDTVPGIPSYIANAACSVKEFAVDIPKAATHEDIKSLGLPRDPAAIAESKTFLSLCLPVLKCCSLSPFSTLSAVELAGCPKVTDVSALHRVRHVLLCDFPDLVDVSPLAAAETVVLRDCPLVDDIASLVSVRQLYIHGYVWKKFSSLFETMNRHRHQPGVLLEAMKFLTACGLHESIQGKKQLTVFDIVLSIMEDHPSDANLQWYACDLINKVMANLRSLLHREELLDRVLTLVQRALLTNQDSPLVIERAFSAFSSTVLRGHEASNGCKYETPQGFVPTVVATMRRYPHDARLQAAACFALGTTADYAKGGCKAIYDAGALAYFVHAITTHAPKVESFVYFTTMLQAMVLILGSFPMVPEYQDVFMESGALEACVLLLRHAVFRQRSSLMHSPTSVAHLENLVAYHTDTFTRILQTCPRFALRVVEKGIVDVLLEIVLLFHVQQTYIVYPFRIFKVLQDVFLQGQNTVIRDACVKVLIELQTKYAVDLSILDYTTNAIHMLVDMNERLQNLLVQHGSLDLAFATCKRTAGDPTIFHEQIGVVLDLIRRNGASQQKLISLSGIGTFFREFKHGIDNYTTSANHPSIMKRLAEILLHIAWAQPKGKMFMHAVGAFEFIVCRLKRPRTPLSVHTAPLLYTVLAGIIAQDHALQESVREQEFLARVYALVATAGSPVEELTQSMVLLRGIAQGNPAIKKWLVELDIMAHIGDRLLEYPQATVLSTGFQLWLELLVNVEFSTRRRAYADLEKTQIAAVLTDYLQEYRLDNEFQFNAFKLLQHIVCVEKWESISKKLVWKTEFLKDRLEDLFRMPNTMNIIDMLPIDIIKELSSLRADMEREEAMFEEAMLAETPATQDRHQQQQQLFASSGDGRDMSTDDLSSQKIFEALERYGNLMGLRPDQGTRTLSSSSASSPSPASESVRPRTTSASNGESADVLAHQAALDAQEDMWTLAQMLTNSLANSCEEEGQREELFSLLKKAESVKVMSSVDGAKLAQQLLREKISSIDPTQPEALNGNVEGAEMHTSSNGEDAPQQRNAPKE